jgi:hypothetical protein
VGSSEVGGSDLIVNDGLTEIQLTTSFVPEEATQEIRGWIECSVYVAIFIAGFAGVGFLWIHKEDSAASSAMAGATIGVGLNTRIDKTDHRVFVSVPRVTMANEMRMQCFQPAQVRAGMKG